jgi:hypothetical protein
VAGISDGMNNAVCNPHCAESPAVSLTIRQRLATSRSAWSKPVIGDDVELAGAKDGPVFNSDHERGGGELHIENPRRRLEAYVPNFTCYACLDNLCIQLS